MLKDIAIENWGSFHSHDQKPEDFDEFWRKGQAEVDELGLRYRLVKRELYSKVAEAFDLYFIGLNGATIHAQLVRPIQGKTKMPVLFQFHGYHSNAGDWGDKVGYAAEGFMTVALNIRGQGGPSEDTTTSKGNSLKGHINYLHQRSPSESRVVLFDKYLNRLGETSSFLDLLRYHVLYGLSRNSLY